MKVPFVADLVMKVYIKNTKTKSYFGDVSIYKELKVKYYLLFNRNPKDNLIYHNKKTQGWDITLNRILKNDITKYTHVCLTSQKNDQKTNDSLVQLKKLKTKLNKNHIITPKN
mgnify:CR=1 FL=1